MTRDYLASLRDRVDRALDGHLPPPDFPPARLHEAMRYAVFAGGKRIRPVCCLLAAESVGGRVDDALPAACALELIHTYSLVHDDLPCMDDDDLRRGRPTVHRAYDEALAVLVGDGLQTLAFAVVAAGLPDAVAARVTARLAEAAGSSGMVGGQVADLDAEGRALSADEVLAIDARKTAALFSAAFACGGLCAGASEEDVARLHQVGRDLGIAFQIVDDILDRTSTSERLGKATGKDEHRGKATLPALIGDDAARDEARRLSERAIEEVRRLRAGKRLEILIERMLRRSH